ncbi:nitrogen-fixing NifU domain protein [Staphylococcus aureus]|nr:nitrogen-fixing NifU domain protein [Staphylococcus aureus]
MPTEDTTMFDQVAEVIERLRPFLLRDGGDCSLIDVEDGIVKLQLHGACGTCQVLQSLLKLVLSVHYTKKCLGVIEVEQVF